MLSPFPQYFREHLRNSHNFLDFPNGHTNSLYSLALVCSTNLLLGLNLHIIYASAMQCSCLYLGELKFGFWRRWYCWMLLRPKRFLIKMSRNYPKQCEEATNNLCKRRKMFLFRLLWIISRSTMPQIYCRMAKSGNTIRKWRAPTLLCMLQNN